MGRKTNYNKMTGSEWRQLLEKQPEFADKCDWSKLNYRDWCFLLCKQPQFADKCDCWDDFGTEEWVLLLSDQPQFADKCDKWDEFEIGDVYDADWGGGDLTGFVSGWIELLRHQPQFSEKIDWSQFSQEDRDNLEEGLAFAAELDTGGYDGEDEEDDEKTAAKKAPEKKKARIVTPAIVEGIVASMVPIPGTDFKMGKFPVTQAQWEAVMGKNLLSEFKGADRPVESVSWYDCQAFLETLNAQPAAKAAGLVFCLPTAKEWEFAARAGATGKYCKLANGTEITKETLGEVAWFRDNSGDETHPVGQKKPNAFGLYDMHGNVWEWTNTAFREERVSRGGGFNDPASDCQFSNRFRCRPENPCYDTGFRLCASGRAD